jgi:hypothetical protein
VIALGWIITPDPKRSQTRGDSMAAHGCAGRLRLLAGITRHPDQAWMEQLARNATRDIWIDVVLFCTIATPSSAHRFG